MALVADEIDRPADLRRASDPLRLAAREGVAQPKSGIFSLPTEPSNGAHYKRPKLPDAKSAGWLHAISSKDTFARRIALVIAAPNDAAGAQMFRVKSPQDFGAALLFLIIGIAGMYFGRDLAFGDASRMGPGFFPTILSGLIALIGVAVGLKSLAIEGPPIEPTRLRPLLFILVAIVAFGYLIEQVGLAITTAALAVFAAYARDSVNLKETVLLALGLSVFAVGVFAYALGQPLPIWWGN